MKARNKQISKFVLTCNKVASRDTAYEPLEHLWTPENPLKEHCGAVAYAVQRLFGGEILSATDEDGVRWLWNCLPNGDELTIGWIWDIPPSRVKVLPKRKTVNKRHALFLARVREALR